MNYMINNELQQQNQVNSIRHLFYECRKKIHIHFDLDVL